jgi:hypothetical protein
MPTSENSRLALKLKWFLENKEGVFIRTKQNYTYTFNDFEILDNFICFKDNYDGSNILISFDDILQICKARGGK